MHALLIVVLVAAAAPKVRHEPLDAAEIERRMQASKAHYSYQSLDRLAGIDSLADVIWPQGSQATEPTRSTRDATDKAIVSELAIAEELFAREEYAQAARHYRDIIKVAPDFSLAWSHLGDCGLFGGDLEGALRSYTKAIALSPDDYRLYFFRGTALNRTGRPKEALEDWITSLVLRPRNPAVLKILRGDGERFGVSVQPELMAPRALARREGGGVTIYADPKSAHWLAWASCKALWLADPAHREELLGESPPGWSAVEEKECVAALVSVYRRLADSEEIPREPRVDQLDKVLRDGLADAFAVYELGSRIDPQITPRLDRGAREALRRYIRKYVLGSTQ